MTRSLLFAAFLAVGSAGCTHRQLDRSTVLATSTVMDIQYRIVLMNLAKLSCQPEALPDHADLADGVVQVNDRLGIGQSGGFSTFAGGGFGLDRLGPSGQRQVTEQWGADATTDPQRLTDLQDLYRTALGMQPLPPPNAIAYLRRRQAESKQRGDSKKEDKDGDSKRRQVPIEILLADVPAPGWFQVGGKKDVPKEACYVGRHGDRYAWVMPEGVRALSRFTVTVLFVVKLMPGEGSKGHGLAVTGQ